MGHGPERHDTHSYEQYDGQWVGFRQPVLRAARSRLGAPVSDTREVNPGEVWEENEFWIELSWRIDPDGSLGIRRYHESRERPGEKLTVDEYYGWMFSHSVPGLPERAAAEGLSPLDWMRRYGAFEISRGQGAVHEQEVPAAELSDVSLSPLGRVYSAAPPAADPNIVPAGAPPPDAAGRRPAGVMVDGVVRRGFPTPSGRLEFWSSTLAAWGWPEHALPGHFRSHVHSSRLAEGQVVLLSTFRLPTQIHTRSANAKWLDELAHTNPVWIHPADAARFGVGRTGDPVRVETEIGHFVAKAWITEGIRPGVVACSHHMGRWRLDGGPRGAGGMMATVGLSRGDDGWQMERRAGRAVRIGRPGQPADLVERHRRAPEPDVRRPPGPDLRHALLAPGRPGPSRRAGRPARGHRGGHPPGPAGLPGLARPGPPGRPGLARRDPPPALADASAEAVRRCVRPPRRGPGSAVTAASATPGRAEHTEVFVLNCPPYASVYLGAEGGLGGKAADRVAGFWRAIGVPPPAEPDHLTALLSLYARLGEAPVAGDGAADPLAPATAGALARARQALFWEHLWPWLPGYLDAVDDLGTPALASWARLVRRALTAERGRHPGGRLPLALRAAPVPSSPVIEPGGPGDLLDMLTASVRSGFVLTRRGLSVAADAAAAGHRIGERRFTLRAMLEQAPAETRRWLSAEAARWSARHESRGPAGDIAQAWWAGRAARTAHLLAAGQAVRLQMPLVAGNYSREVPLSDRVPDLAALEMLLAVAHTGSLNVASRQLGITQQAVSARVRSAEAQAGVALIARTPRGSSLTPEGVVAAEWAARLLAVAGELDAGLAAFRTGHQTRLRVSASLTIAEQLLPGWLVSLQAGARHRGHPAPQIC
jgi:TorA maturation chaperone TorD/molybdenum-dependent DNA-binding transcriptional regulator ModE